MPAEPLRFDAKICGFRRAKDGIVISLVVHPESDCIAPLAILPVGFECCVEISGPADDAPTQRIVDAAKTHSQLTNSRSAEQTQGDITQPAGRVLSQKERYAGMSEGEKAVARAGMLCGDENFREWIRSDAPVVNQLVKTAGDAADWMRFELEISSRSEIATKTDALQKFLALETEYLMATGKMASPS